MSRRIPQATKDEIVRRYQAEEIGMLTLAQQYGVNLQSVSNWLRAAGIKIRCRGLRVGCRREYRREKEAARMAQIETARTTQLKPWPTSLWFS